MTLGHIIFLVVFFIRFTGIQMSSQVLEAKKGKKISVEIKKNRVTIYWNRALILSCFENILILEKSSHSLCNSSLNVWSVWS